MDAKFKILIRQQLKWNNAPSGWVPRGWQNKKNKMYQCNAIHFPLNKCVVSLGFLLPIFWELQVPDPNNAKHEGGLQLYTCEQSPINYLVKSFKYKSGIGYISLVGVIVVNIRWISPQNLDSILGFFLDRDIPWKQGRYFNDNSKTMDQWSLWIGYLI